MARKIFPLLKEFDYTAEASPDLQDFLLFPKDASKPILHFKVVRDDLTRSILYLRNSADVLYDTLSLTKTNWMKNHGHPIFEAPGHNLGFLGFQMRDPILKELKVRQAIALALPLQDWIQYKFFNWVILSSDAVQNPDLNRANILLDQAGFPIQPDGFRFHLRYLTTPVREGNEMAYLNREALKKIGIDVQIKLLETSLFFSKLKSGDFQLFGSFISRNSPDEPIYEFFSEHGTRNYFKYQNQSLGARFESNPKLSWDQAKDEILKDLPIIPFYEWKHGLLVSDRIVAPEKIEEKLDESFRFLPLLQLK